MQKKRSSEAKKRTEQSALPTKPRTEKTKVVLTGMVNDWMRRIEGSRASKDRIGFFKTAQMCHQFYAGCFAFMWEDQFRSDYLSGIPAPRFKITIAKGAELVGIYGPGAMWDYPGRVIKGIKKFKMTREMFTSDEEFQLYEEEWATDELREKVRNELMSVYLNWAHRQQPGGGMIVDSHKAIVEALVKGRGVLFTDLYEHPSADDRRLTRSSFVSVDDLFLDPECRNSNLTDCHWIAIKRRTPYWELERRFDLPEDSLKDKATKETLSSMSVNNTFAIEAQRRSGLLEQTSDIVEWYEIFSKEGVGNRNKRWAKDYNQTIGDVVGDYAYMAICSRCDYPLNFSPQKSRRAKDEDIRDAFEWPVPQWKDGGWPVSLLDFYTQPNSAWPISILSMGLGELVLLNVIISCIADRVYEGLRTYGLVADQISNDVLSKLKNFDYSGFVEVPGDVVAHIKDLITYVQTPEVSSNVWTLVEYVSEMFDKRTGLIGRLYGEPGGQPRSAEESQYQQQATTTRPEWINRCVEDWQTCVANRERIAAGWGVEGKSLIPTLGSRGAQLWDELIAEENPDVFVFQMNATLEANSIRKPNKAKDAQNLQQVSSYLLPLFDRYFQMTGDTMPLNSFLTAMADSMEHDPSGWLLPEQKPPEPDPSEQLAQQVAAENLKGKQLRNEKLQREIGGPAPMEQGGGGMPMEGMPGMPGMEGMPEGMMGGEGMPPDPSMQGLPPEIMQMIAQGQGDQIPLDVLAQLQMQMEAGQQPGAGGQQLPSGRQLVPGAIPGLEPTQFEPVFKTPYPPLNNLRPIRGM